MSVISSRSTAVSSILKGPGVRSKLLTQRNRVNFQLPKNLKNILINYESGVGRKVYEDLICILRDSKIKDNELMELLTEVRQCISLLGDKHKILVEALLKIDWTTRTPDATAAYKAFLEDLICVHSYHCKLVMDNLVSHLKPMTESENEWVDGEPSEEEVNKMNHIRDVLFKIVTIVPMSSSVLLQCLSTGYPYLKGNTHTHEVYLHFLLEIMNHAPQLRPEILYLVINKLVMLDVNAPRAEIESYRDGDVGDDKDEAVFEMDQDTDEKEHPLAHTLDVCMKKLLKYIYETCHPMNTDVRTLNLENVKILYQELIQIFEKVILPTYASHHIQFIMFYICSFNRLVVEAFINRLWNKVSNPNVAPIIRQSSVAYIASLLARGKFISMTHPNHLLLDSLREMAQWTHSYIAAQDSLECANSDVRVHTVFYAVCQAMFYVVGFRYKDLVETKKNLLILQGLNFTKIITCRLNPLKVCLPVVVQHFAAVTRAYQLAYCYTVIEHNSRSNLPVIENSNRFATWLDTFFPFDPYVLRQSSDKIDPLYLHYQGSISTDAASLSGTEENDEDDFMDVCFPQHQDQHMDKFSYSTSPGFIQH